MGGCSEVDPIVASFFRGAMGIIMSFMVVELNNVKQQETKALQIMSWHRYLFLTPFGSSMCGVSGGLLLHMIL